MAPSVLMVAEKPSLAQSIASLLSDGQMSSRRGSLEVHEFSGLFHGRHANFKMTSVIGHVYSLDFTAQYQNWETTDPGTLFSAETRKAESNPKAHVCEHLQREARGVDYLVLWLDCDREGENICFEVMENTVAQMRPAPGRGEQQVYRAKFSAISKPEIVAAMSSLVVPNRNEALAVDARQELDLKMGVAFTRFQTHYFQGKYGNLDSRVISYGPCQTPIWTMERHQRTSMLQPQLFWLASTRALETCQPQPFWSLKARVQKGGFAVPLEWDRGRLFDRDAVVALHRMVLDSPSATVESVVEKEERKARPCGLNTVELLKVLLGPAIRGCAESLDAPRRLFSGRAGDGALGGSLGAMGRPLRACIVRTRGVVAGDVTINGLHFSDAGRGGRWQSALNIGLPLHAMQ
ncbi:hypothetical protein CYMTET_28876, partial [Cymbomonas tetramitiformis]